MGTPDGSPWGPVGCDLGWKHAVLAKSWLCVQALILGIAVASPVCVTASVTLPALFLLSGGGDLMVSETG